jgi:hypothetical protein
MIAANFDRGTSTHTVAARGDFKDQPAQRAFKITFGTLQPGLRVREPNQDVLLQRRTHRTSKETCGGECADHSPTDESVPRPSQNAQPVRNICCGALVSRHRRGGSPRKVVVQHPSHQVGGEGDVCQCMIEADDRSPVQIVVQTVVAMHPHHEGHISITSLYRSSGERAPLPKAVSRGLCSLHVSVLLPAATVPALVDAVCGATRRVLGVSASRRLQVGTSPWVPSPSHRWFRVAAR